MFDNRGKRKIGYSIIYSVRRTLEIAVYPDTSIDVTAPQNCKDNAITEECN